MFSVPILRRAPIFSPAPGISPSASWKRNFKYIYDFSRERSQLYDLAADPREENNLASDPPTRK